MIKAIIFDMDGVLVDAREWHFLALNRALQLFGYEITRGDHLSIFDGLPTSSKLKMLTEQNQFPEQLHLFVGEMKQKYTEQEISEHCRPVFRVEYALSELKKQGYLLGLGTNSISYTKDLMLRKSAINHYFDIALSNEDVMYPKPNPEIYIKIINFFGLSPNECLILEDNAYGLEAAKLSGAHVLKINSVEEVNLKNIMQKITLCEVVA